MMQAFSHPWADEQTNELYAIEASRQSDHFSDVDIGGQFDIQRYAKGQQKRAREEE